MTRLIVLLSGICIFIAGAIFGVEVGKRVPKTQGYKIPIQTLYISSGWNSREIKIRTVRFDPKTKLLHYILENGTEGISQVPAGWTFSVIN